MYHVAIAKRTCARRIRWLFQPQGRAHVRHRPRALLHRRRAEEWRLRCDMAAVFRVAARLGWNEQIGNHNSLMLPQRPAGRSAAVPDQSARLSVPGADGEFADRLRPRRACAARQGRVAQGGVPHPRADPPAKAGRGVHPARASAVPDRAGAAGGPAVCVGAPQQSAAERSRAVDDTWATAPVGDMRKATGSPTLMGDKTIMVMGGHGVTVVGPTVHDAFDELLHGRAHRDVSAAPRCPPACRCAVCRRARAGDWHGAWGEKIDARLHLDAWRRVLDREEPDYAS